LLVPAASDLWPTERRLAVILSGSELARPGALRICATGHNHARSYWSKANLLVRACDEIRRDREAR
jgi:hypothetical protein